MKTEKLIFLVCLFHISIFVQAQALLDASFGENGHTYTDIDNSNDVANDICIQADNKILVAGFTSNGVKDFFCLIRYAEDGSPDLSFGHQGIVITEFPSTSVAHALALQTDGKIILAGHTWGGQANELAMVRYHTDGSIDESFGNMGKLTTRIFDKNAFCSAIHLQTDGKIVLAGHSYTFNNDADDFLLARYHENGQLDSSFGDQGISITSLGSFTMDWIRDLDIQADGKILAAGFSGSLFAMVRYLDNGALDSSFGDNGISLTQGGSSHDGALNSVEVLADNSILAAGYVRDSFSNSVLLKFTANGVLDPSFGDNGMSVIPVSTANDVLEDLCVQPDGEILVGGTALVDDIQQFSLMRFLDNGELDTDYGQEGFAAIGNYNTAALLHKIVVQHNDKVITCGQSLAYPSDFLLSRYHSELVNVHSPKIAQANIKLYPNPSAEQIQFSYSLFEKANLSIVLMASDGRRVATISERTQQNKGLHTLNIVIDQLARGHYYLLMHIDQQVHSFPFVKQ